MLFTSWSMVALLSFDFIKGQTEIGQMIYTNLAKCHFSVLLKSKGNQEQRSHLWVTWEPRKLDMVSSRFCRRSSTFCTVLFLWDSGSVGKMDSMFKVDIMFMSHRNPILESINKGAHYKQLQAFPYFLPFLPFCHSPQKCFLPAQLLSNNERQLRENSCQGIEGIGLNNMLN